MDKYSGCTVGRQMPWEPPLGACTPLSQQPSCLFPEPSWPTRPPSRATYRHGLECDLLVVVNGLLLIQGAGVTEASDVYQVAEVEGHGDSQQACGRLLQGEGGEGMRGSPAPPQSSPACSRRNCAARGTCAVQPDRFEPAEPLKDFSATEKLNWFKTAVLGIEVGVCPTSGLHSQPFLILRHGLTKKLRQDLNL